VCGIVCSSQIGLSEEVKRVYWGGSKGNQTVEYGPRLVHFFCSDHHRNEFLVSGDGYGELQGWHGLDNEDTD
jgi:hypothetical protein